MRHRVLYAPLWACLPVLFFACGATHAEIYKWVDEKGRTHYSHNKADAERAKGTQLNIPKNAPAKTESSSYWDYVTDKSKQQQPTEAPATAPEPQVRPNSRGIPVTSDPRYDGIDDAARCTYALDILNGTIRLPNGELYDEYDRKLAKDDVARFCR